MASKRILVVDDDDGATRLIKLNLELSAHYEVRVENDPRRAIAAAQQFRPDFILLDVMMPGLDGGELALLFRETPGFKNVPIGFLSAAVDKNEVGGAGKSIGGFPFLSKPVDMHDLKEFIDRHL